MSEEQITAAVVGMSQPHASAHLRTLQTSDRIGRIAICDADQGVLDRVRAEHGDKVQAAYTDIAGLLQGESLLFSVCNLENDLNAAACQSLIEGGVHVFSEKPIGRTAAEVESVTLAAEAAGLKLGVAYCNRALPNMELARQLVADGVIGRITSIEGRMVTSQPRFRQSAPWLFDVERAGGGILSWLGCHYFDLMRFVSGDEVTAVSGMVDSLSETEVTVEDVAAVNLRFGDGAIGSLRAGYELALSGSGYAGGAYDSYLGFRGTAGRIVWRYDEAPLNLHVESSTEAWKTAPRRTFTFEQPDDVPAYGGQHGLDFVHAFVDAALGRGEPTANGRDALAVARIIEAAYASSASGRQVDL